jgi:hypothetical protein
MESRRWTLVAQVATSIVVVLWVVAAALRGRPDGLATALVGVVSMVDAGIYLFHLGGAGSALAQRVPRGSRSDSVAVSSVRRMLGYTFAIIGAGFVAGGIALILSPTA